MLYNLLRSLSSTSFSLSKLPAPVGLNIYFHLCLSSLFSLWLHVISKILNCKERTEDRQPTHSMWPLACHNVTWHGMDFKIWCLVKLYYGDKTLGLVRWRVEISSYNTILDCIDLNKVFVLTINQRNSRVLLGSVIMTNFSQICLIIQQTVNPQCTGSNFTNYP